jgi:transcriptional regulator with XRE-family HTH domain
MRRDFDPALAIQVKKIGDKLIELRKAKGFASSEDFANHYNLPRVQYWRLEKGVANWTFKTLLKILAIHGLTLEGFFDLLYRSQKKKK